MDESLIRARCSHIGRSDDGTYHCHSCGHRWRPRDRFQYWPIRLHWKTAIYPRCWFTWHGWEAGGGDLFGRVYGWTFHLGRLTVSFGRIRT